MDDYIRQERQQQHPSVAANPYLDIHSQNEKIRELTNTLMARLLCRNDYDNLVVRTLLREIISSMVLMPFIQMLSTPDVLYSFVITLFESQVVADSVDGTTAPTGMLNSKTISVIRVLDTRNENSDLFLL
jgi:hypothetical protein